jgi:hypothetical protein
LPGVRAILSIGQDSLSIMTGCVEVEEEKVKDRKSGKIRSQTEHIYIYAQQCIFAHIDHIK